MTFPASVDKLKTAPGFRQVLRLAVIIPLVAVASTSLCVRQFPTEGPLSPQETVLHGLLQSQDLPASTLARAYQHPATITAPTPSLSTGLDAGDVSVPPGNPSRGPSAPSLFVRLGTSGSAPPGSFVPCPPEC